MATVSDVVALVAQEKTVEAGIETLLTQLTALIAALKNQPLPPAVQAQVDGLVTDLTANIAAMQAAITANTPAP